MFAPPLAHLGHWYVSLPVFMGPAVVLVAALKANAWRERHAPAERSEKRSHVSAELDGDGRGPRITVTGPLDFPALLDIDVELGQIARRAPGREIVLDMRGVVEADREAAWSLCEAIDNAPFENRVRVLVGSEPGLEALRRICAEEGIELLARG